jgi:hypothetical protein
VDSDEISACASKSVQLQQHLLQRGPRERHGDRLVRQHAVVCALGRDVCLLGLERDHAAHVGGRLAGTSCCRNSCAVVAPAHVQIRQLSMPMSDTTYIANCPPKRSLTHTTEHTRPAITPPCASLCCLPTAVAVPHHRSPGRTSSGKLRAMMSTTS